VNAFIPLRYFLYRGPDIDPARCAHEVAADASTWRQCSLAATVELHGHRFCTRHAKWIRARQGEQEHQEAEQ
jgi:hypothetical protein